MRKLLSAVVATGLAVGLAGCVDDPEDVPALNISRAEVWRQINANLHQVDPDWRVTPWPGTMLDQSGCATDSSTWMPTGPPWKYQVTDWTPDADADFLEKVQKGLDSLARQGFTVKPPPRPDDPRDRVATDARGFRVDVTFDDEPDGKLRVDLESRSPCVRHPGESDDWSDR